LKRVEGENGGAARKTVEKRDVHWVGQQACKKAARIKLGARSSAYWSERTAQQGIGDSNKKRGDKKRDTRGVKRGEKKLFREQTGNETQGRGQGAAGFSDP